MRAVDTNAVVRLVVRDDPEQVRAAEEFAASGAWISHLVLVETAWVLDAVYERTAEQIATGVEMLLNHKDLTLQDADVVVLYSGFPTASFSRSRARRDTCRSVPSTGTWRSWMERCV
jgi:predicted nucleic-acid-binding protein